MFLHAISNIDLYMQGLHFTRCIQIMHMQDKIPIRLSLQIQSYFQLLDVHLTINSYVIKSFNHAMKLQCLVSILNKINNIPKRHQLLLWPWFHKVDLPLVNIYRNSMWIYAINCNVFVLSLIYWIFGTLNFIVIHCTDW